MRQRRNGSREWFANFHESLWLRGDETGAEEAAAIKRLLRLRKGQSVLDAPCGAGRIALPLARAGCNVTGIDRMASFIARARRRFRKEGLKGRFLQCDMRELDFEGEFDAVINWGGSFGYFSDTEDLDVLRRFARALKPGGRLMMDGRNREWVLRHFQPQQCRGDVKITNKWNPTTQRAEIVWRLTVDGEPRSYDMGIRLYTPGQFRRLFANAGLEIEAMYGNLDGSEYSRGSRRIYVLGWKK